MPEKHTAYVAVEGYIESSMVKELMQKIVELGYKKPVFYLLIDSSRLEIVRSEDIQWIVQHIFPVLRKSNIKKVGYIRSQNVFGQVSLEKLLPKNTQKEFRFFKTIEEAEDWIYYNRLPGMHKVG